MGLGTQVAKLNCFSQREEIEDLEEVRVKGREELRALMFSKEPVDWKAVMIKAHELQVREDKIFYQQELEEARERDKKEVREKQKRYDRFGRLVVSKIKHDNDDGMRVGLLVSKGNDRQVSKKEDRSVAGNSYDTLSEHTSDETILSDDDRLYSRSYFLPDKASL